jgi:helicase MOV-10
MKPNCSLQIHITFDTKHQPTRGRFTDRIELVFLDVHLRHRFCITRPLKAAIGSSADYEALRASAPYVRPKRKTVEPIREVVPGVPPECIMKCKWMVRLLPYEVPRELERVLRNGIATNSKGLVQRVRDVYLPGGLSEEKYASFFSVLLWVEEERSR